MPKKADGVDKMWYEKPMISVRIDRSLARLGLMATISSFALISGLACDNADVAHAASDAKSTPAEAATSESGAAAEPTLAPAAVAGAAVQELTGEQAYDEESFALELHGPTAAKVGEVVELKLILAAKNGFKVNQEYPVKFAFAASPGVKPGKEVVRKEDGGKIEKARFELPLSVTLTEAGARKVGGKLSFSVCTEDRCLIEKRELLLTINAS